MGTPDEQRVEYRSRDEVIGGNLSRLRGGTNQKDLAEAMRQRGHKWSQATVWSAEKGNRPLRLTEAVSISEILGVPMDQLLYDPQKDEVRALTEAANKRVEALSQLKKAQESAEEALALWRRAVDDYAATHGRESLGQAVKYSWPGDRRRAFEVDPDQLFAAAAGLLSYEWKGEGTVGRGVTRGSDA